MVITDRKGSKVSISVDRDGYVVDYIEPHRPSEERGLQPLQSLDRDIMNVIWAAIAWNTKKWVRRAQGSGKNSKGMGKKEM